jgi:transposase
MRYELSDYEWSVIRPMLPNSHAAFLGWMTGASYSQRHLLAARGQTSRRNAIARTRSHYLCRDRNLVEPFLNKIKQCRRIATRYDKLAANYLAVASWPASAFGWAFMNPRPS